MLPRSLGGVFVVLAPVCFAFGGCLGDDAPASPPGSTPDGGAGPTDAGPDPTDAGPGPGDAAAPTACPLGCLPPAPPGWAGPSAVYDGPPTAKPAGCPDEGYTNLEVDAHRGMTAAQAACACGVPSLQDAYCSASVETWTGAGCSGNPLFQGTANSNGACVTSTDGMSPSLRVTAPNLASRGSCSYPSATEEVPPPEFQSVTLACGLPQAGACEGRPDCAAAPVPKAPFTRVCIHKEDAVDCPTEDYTQRFVVYQDVNDTRACSACAGIPKGGTCGTTWGLGSGMACGAGLAPSDKTAGACYPNPGASAKIDARGLAPSGITCEPSGGEPVGEAVSEGAVTFCCSR